MFKNAYALLRSFGLVLPAFDTRKTSKDDSGYRNLKAASHTGSQNGI